MDFRENSYWFINNMEAFSDLIADELNRYVIFKNIEHTSFIDSVINNYKAKFTLRIAFDDRIVTANFINNYGNLELDYKVRQGHKVIDKHHYKFGVSQYYEWGITDCQDAYDDMIKMFRKHINEIVKQ